MRAWSPLAVLAVLLAGCRSDTNVPHRRDAGTFDAEADVPTPVEDAGADAVDEDAGVDAGTSCPCPTLPSSCTPPPVGEPAFGPDSAAYDGLLLGTFACAERTLRIAIYEAAGECIPTNLRTRLETAPELRVEIVFDDEQCPRGMDGRLGCGLALLEGHPRVALRPDDRSALMHHKWVIEDDERVWVASGNFSNRSFCTDHNDAIVIDRGPIVDAYEAQFARMFRDGQFGPTPPAEPVADGPFRVHFGPQSPIDEPPAWFRQMIERIGAARTSVDAMINAFTRTEVSDALIAAHMRGVRVRVVVSSMYVREAAVQALIASGVPVRLATMHSKVLVVDEAFVVAGSANWSMSAWRNNENVLFIEDAALARRYAARAAEVFASARAP
ncbi:MAG: phosphatidylserine/phosphatidylglycerophosphate/cardiolipin synthase family protein [Myxococcota bacterium]|nr:phosphatidylserine/phosphatidylglycerophosphate/cardiolipin synthase family protein [Myxococcota bacterium]MDW8364079.1 phosphatidylserine/phosphatidylglycerophosphate/cardiolipin synthase family protein [Myxococcales bacterium]